MSANVSAAMILYERSGRWAASLRRHVLAARVKLIETRSLSDLEQRIGEQPSALVGLELSAATADRTIDWLCRRAKKPAPKATIVLAARGLRAYEMLCREAGALHFVDSELGLFALNEVLDRYLSDAAFAKLDEEELPLEERIRAAFPW